MVWSDLLNKKDLYIGPFGTVFVGVFWLESIRDTKKRHEKGLQSGTLLLVRRRP